MPQPNVPASPSLEEQAALLKSVNLEIMGYLHKTDTLPKAKKRLAWHLFDIGVGTLDTYADKITPQEIGRSLEDDANFSVYADREVVSKKPEAECTWYGLVYSNGVFSKNIAVGKVHTNSVGRDILPFEVFGFDNVDLTVMMQASIQLMTLRRQGRLPNLASDLLEVEPAASHAETGVDS